jgi:hypothetical protein
MLYKNPSNFFTPAYVHPTALCRFHPRPVLSRRPSRLQGKRGYATNPNLSGSSTHGSTGGIPLGQIPLGAKAAPQKGIAIKDDITKSWKELSIPQKIVRTGTQTTNFAIIIVGVGVVVRERGRGDG